MRIVSRPDFDGIVCATLLYEMETITEPTFWVEPHLMQKALVDVFDYDIIANLPYHPNAAMWFDHHFSNKVETNFKGLYRIAPSAASLIYEYYQSDKLTKYIELVRETDRIDSANLSMDEVNYPEKYPYVLLSMTIMGREKTDESYWNFLAEELRHHPIKRIMQIPEVNKRCKAVEENNKLYENLLISNTVIDNQVAISDFRKFKKAPPGNRFLVYARFPETVVHLKITNDSHETGKIIVSVGHSIFNPQCNVNVGALLKNFEGGGHRGAGSCSFHESKYDEYMPQILDILKRNEPNDSH